MFLLDTNVVSDLRKARLTDSKVVAWAKTMAATSQFMSVITVLELELGILVVERRDPRQGAALRGLLDDRVVPAFAERILPIDTAIARRCAGLHVPDPKSERDALIAATALVHGTTVVTRNTGDFATAGVALLDPWSA